MARIPESVLDEIRERVAIEELVARYIDLNRSNKGLCPFHQDKRPSFSVSPEKQIYKCFSCGAGGNIFTFYQHMESCNFYEAITALAKDANIDISSFDDKQDKDRDARVRMYLIVEESAVFFEKSLQVDSLELNSVRDYIVQRKISKDNLFSFRIGYAPNGNAIITHLKNKGFTEQEMLDAGLVVKNQKSGEIFSKFRDRLIFPIIDKNGAVCAFGGRALKKDQVPKYLNSPETLIYHKSKELYGFFQNKQVIKKNSFVYIVEGYMDLMALAAVGINNVVASCGTAFTKEMAKLIKRLNVKIMMLYDGDLPGRKATLKAFPLLMAENLFVRTFSIPDEMDPDDLLNKWGVEKFKKEIKNNKNVAEYAYELYQSEYDLKLSENKSLFLREFKELLSNIKDQIVIWEMNAIAADLVKIPRELHLKNFEKVPQKEESANNNIHQKIDTKIPRHEKRFMQLLTHAETSVFEKFSLLIKDDINNLFTERKCIDLYKLLSERNGYSPNMLNECTDAERQIITELAAEKTQVENIEQELADLQKKLKMDSLSRERKKLMHDFGSQNVDHETITSRVIEINMQLHSMGKIESSN